MEFYVASGLENRERAAGIIALLTQLGHTPAYDWTQHGDVRQQGEVRMQQVAQSEAAAVARAELVVLMLPGGHGTHTELGIALCSRETKQILLWSETGKEFGRGSDTCVFYHHPAILHLSGPVESLREYLVKHFSAH